MIEVFREVLIPKAIDIRTSLKTSIIAKRISPKYKN